MRNDHLYGLSFLFGIMLEAFVQQGEKNRVENYKLWQSGEMGFFQTQKLLNRVNRHVIEWRERFASCVFNQR